MESHTYRGMHTPDKAPPPLQTLRLNIQSSFWVLLDSLSKWLNDCTQMPRSSTHFNSLNRLVEKHGGSLGGDVL